MPKSSSIVVPVVAAGSSILVIGIGILAFRKRSNASSSSSTVSSSIPALDRTKENNTYHVCVIGGGVIGSSFCSVFLGRGMKVSCIDPFVSRDVVEKRIQDHWPHLVARGITTLEQPPLATSFCMYTDNGLEQSLRELEDERKIDFVQECTYEDVANKQTVLQLLDTAIDPNIIISSSTSFIPWDLLVTKCTNNKQRILIGHPAIPHTHSYMEIYGISTDYVQYAKQWYHHVSGFDVIVMKQTTPGHVLNSFLRVNMEHANKLLLQNICTPEDISTALRHLGRDFYARDFYVSALVAVGGDRGIEGGVELVKKITNDAIHLILFSVVKQSTVGKYLIPDFAIRCLGRAISLLLTQNPMLNEEHIRASQEFVAKITKNGTIPVQRALFQLCYVVYKELPLEIGNDPYSLEERMKTTSD